MDMKKLRELLKNVPGSYYDFVEGIIDTMKDYGNKERYNELVESIEKNPDIDTDDIIEMTRYPEIPKVVIVDDDEV